MTDICAICGQPLGVVRISFTSGDPAAWLHPDCAKFDPDMTTAHIRSLMGKIEMLRDRLAEAERLLQRWVDGDVMETATRAFLADRETE